MPPMDWKSGVGQGKWKCRFCGFGGNHQHWTWCSKCKRHWDGRDGGERFPQLVRHSRNTPSTGAWAKSWGKGKGSAASSNTGRGGTFDGFLKHLQEQDDTEAIVTALELWNARQKEKKLLEKPGHERVAVLQKALNSKENLLKGKQEKRTRLQASRDELDKQLEELAKQVEEAEKECAKASQDLAKASDELKEAAGCTKRPDDQLLGIPQNLLQSPVWATYKEQMEQAMAVVNGIAKAVVDAEAAQHKPQGEPVVAAAKEEHDASMASEEVPLPDDDFEMAEQEMRGALAKLGRLGFGADLAERRRILEKPAPALKRQKVCG